MNPWNLAEDRVYTCPRVPILLNARGALQSAQDGQTNVMQLMLDIEPQTARPWLQMKDDDGRTALNLWARDGHVASGRRCCVGQNWMTAWHECSKKLGCETSVQCVAYVYMLSLAQT